MRANELFINVLFTPDSEEKTFQWQYRVTSHGITTGGFKAKPALSGPLHS